MASTVKEGTVEQNESEKPMPKTKIVWFNVFSFIYLHVSLVYGVYLAFTSAYLTTSIFAVIYAAYSLVGITAGSHRLWCHRSYKAKWPFRIFLMIGASIAAQNHIFSWCRDHRLHHKFTETNADPYSIHRGFFFAHMGWLMVKKHPDVISKGKTINLDDLLADPIVRFQRRFHTPLVILLTFYLPTMIPVWFWNETAWNAYFVAAMARHCISLQVTCLVNSVAHRFGNQPFDKSMSARESMYLSIFIHGEGWHNYHHVFPWDYSASELGYTFNLTKLLIDLMEIIGQAYDLKKAGPDMIKDKKIKSGDGTRMKQVEF